jgi:hypothetical protein
MPEREPSRFAAGGRDRALKIHQLLLSSNALRTETVRAPAKLISCRKLKAVHKETQPG